MRIGILECGPALPEIASRHGTYPEMFARLLSGHGWTFPSWCVHRMEFPPDVRAAEGWLLTGSRYGVYDDQPFIAPLEQFIRDARAADRPMLGICFGHQIMAQALGGQAGKASQGWGFGRQVYDFDGLGPLGLTAIHQDQVTRAPDSARIVAGNAFCPIAALRYDDWGFSVQPHPEFDRDATADFIEIKEKTGDIPADLVAAARDRLAEPLDTPRMVAMMADFFKTALNRPEGPREQAPDQPLRHRSTQHV